MPASKTRSTKTAAKTTTRKRVTKATTDAADAQIASELSSVDLDAAVAQATADETPAASTPATPKPKRGELQLPVGVSPRELILQFLTETCSPAPDAAGQGRSYITAKGKVVTHAQWFAKWLTTRLGAEVNTVQSSKLLRDNGWKDRSLPVVGAATTRLSVWVIDAPRGTAEIERQPAIERKQPTVKATTTAKPKATPAVDQAAIIAAVRKHAADHYADGDGWDNVVEAFDDAQLAEIIGKSRTSLTAIAKVGKYLKPIASRDAEAAAFAANERAAAGE